MRGDGPDWLDADEGGYTFLVLVAHEARKASRKYWAPGGWADREYPLQAMPWWPDPAARRQEDVDLAERRRRRRGR
jgi:hypothetical protein